MMLTRLKLAVDNPYVQDWYARQTVRVNASKELLETDVPAADTRYAAWVRSLPECQDWPQAKVLHNTEYIRAMTRRICKNGYDEEEFQAWSKANQNHWFPIKVAMEEDGRLFIGDGNRRAIALVMCGSDFEAVVYHRDPAWVATMKTVRKPNAWLYQNHPHPEFDGLRVGRPGADRFEVIRGLLEERGIGNLVVLGSNYGVGCLHLAKNGARVVGVERSEHYERMQRGLFAVHPGLRLTSVHGDVTTVQAAGVQAVVGFSVWHHLAQSVAMLDRCIRHFASVPMLLVELPERSSQIWPEGLKAETRMPTTELGPFIINRMCEIGDYKVERTVYVDHSYNGRETVLLAKR